MIYTYLNKIVQINDDLNDYKFFCFNGEPRFFKVDFGRFIEHHANYYDLDWNLLPYGEVGLAPDPNHEFMPPPHFKEMVELARKLSHGEPFLRVDLYNLAGRIYFGELTFFPASGFGRWTHEEDDYTIGKLFSSDGNMHKPESLRSTKHEMTLKSNA